MESTACDCWCGEGEGGGNEVVEAAGVLEVGVREVRVHRWWSDTTVQVFSISICSGF